MEGMSFLSTRTSVKTDAIVLRRQLLPSQDAIFSLYTRDVGKVVAYARGVKKITSKRLAHLQTGNYIHVELEHRHNQYYVGSTSLYSGFATLKSMPMALDALYQGLFCLDRLMPQGQSDTIVFDSTLRMASALSRRHQTHHTHIHTYLEDLLAQLGYEQYSGRGIAHLYKTVEELTNEKMPSGII